MTSVLVSGAGIAGTALACWLGRQGHEVTVVERAPAPRPGGQAVDLRGAGRVVVERMGLMPQARAIGLEQEGIAWVDASGRVVARMPADAFGGEGIISEIEILRGDLGEMFYRATLPGTEYLFDDTITALEQDDDGVSVTFRNHAPRRFGLVVGADGLHSVVRRLAFGPEPDCVRPLDVHMAWFTAPEAPDIGGWYTMFNAPGLVASIRPGRLPGSSKASLSFRGEASYDRGDLAGQRDLLAARFAGAGWKVPWLVEAMRSAPDLTLDRLGQVRLPSWTAGRVALVGDAGYCPSPLTGLGTSLALVGAYVLGCELTAAGGDHRRAFRRYDEVVRPYVTQAQELPPGGTRGYAPASRLGIAASHASMRWMNRWPVKPFMVKQFAKAGAIELPVYATAAS